MKQSIVFSILVLTAGGWVLAQAQKNTLHPIVWQYGAKKIAERTYEVHLTAQLEAGWHAYSQQQPKDAVAQPTKMGALEKWKDAASGIMANQYANKVDFIQVVRLKANVRTNVSGSLTYQVCTDEMCLPPRTETFSISLGE
jgi:hypothetical protein